MTHHILFICSRNQWRSPTAETIWRNSNSILVRSAGISPKARRTVNAADIRWADVIFVMERKHQRQLKAQFGQLVPIAEMNGWISPRLKIRFVLSETDLEVYQPDGRKFLPPVEFDQRVKLTEQRAVTAEQRAERLAARLRQMGLDPDDF